MGAGASAIPLTAPYQTREAALADGKTIAEIDHYLTQQQLNVDQISLSPGLLTPNGTEPAPTPVPTVVVDPWQHLPPPEQLHILLSVDDDATKTPPLLHHHTVTLPTTSDTIAAPTEANVGLSIFHEDSTATTIPTPLLPDELLPKTVSLSYAQGALTSWSLKATTNLRQLNLSGCPLNASPFFSSVHLSKLLVLVLDFSDIPSLGELEFSQLHQLKRLSMEACSLSTLHGEDGVASPLEHLKVLEYLNISDNELEDAESIMAALCGVKGTLIELDLRDNEIREVLGRKKYDTLLLSKIFDETTPLQKLDNKTLNRGGGAQVAKVQMLSQVEGIANALSSKEFEHLEDRGSCSCLAGNACVEQYNCKDWKNRFKIAKEVRKMKGMEEVPGLG
jgi:Leucine-rich repeat (LRR) protein